MVPTDKEERTPTDYALEFAEYLAKAAERHLAARERLHVEQGEEDGRVPDPDAICAAEESESDHAAGVRSAVYEFRKRAERARNTPSATPFKQQDADMLAAAVDRAILAGWLDSRSEIADCRLDYGKPFSSEEVERHLSKRRHGKNQTSYVGESKS